jgi:hypothetical protein
VSAKSICEFVLVFLFVCQEAKALFALSNAAFSLSKAPFSLSNAPFSLSNATLILIALHENLFELYMREEHKE